MGLFRLHASHACRRGTSFGSSWGVLDVVSKMVSFVVVCLYGLPGRRDLFDPVVQIVFRGKVCLPFASVRGGPGI